VNGTAQPRKEGTVYPMDREAYIHAYLGAMKEEIEQANFARENGCDDSTQPGDHFFRSIAEKLSHWHRSEPMHDRWMPSH